MEARQGRKINGQGLEMKLNLEEVERFAQEYAISGNPSAAYRAAKPNNKSSSSSATSISARRWLEHPVVSARIKELEELRKAKDSLKFSITVEKRLRWLQEIVEAGLATYSDNAGNARRENLSAAKGAIEVINDMLGTGEDDEAKGDPLEITFQVSAPKRDIRITRADGD